MELRKPKEDSEISNKIEIPAIPRIGGLKLTGQGFADLLMSFEFLHNFGETLGFGMTSTNFNCNDYIIYFTVRHGIFTSSSIIA